MRPTLPQILKADRQVFLYMIRAGADLKRQPDNTLQLDTLIFTALQSYEVGFHLLPLHTLAAKPETAVGQSYGPSGEGKGKGSNWQSNRAGP